MRLTALQFAYHRSTVLLLLIIVTVLPGSPSRIEPSDKFKNSEAFFNKPQVATLKIDITGTNLAALRQDNRRYVRGTISENGATYEDVAIHLKGAAGSFRQIDDFPALTLNFDKFNERQKFHGMDKIHLNNSVQDPTFMTEIICGELFRAAGVPATLGTHARVLLNGRDLGLYVLKEGFDKEFLHEFFPNPRGNLYDGGFLRDITDPLQRTSGKDVKDYSDLKALVAAAQEVDPVKRMERLDKVLDLDRFLSFIAMELMTYHWDGYALKRNNYRVFHDLSTGKMVFFPHGMDQMFSNPNEPFMHQMDGLVANSIVTTEEGRRRYRERVATLFETTFKVDVLTNRINELQQHIRPVLAAINPERARNHDGAVENLRNQIIARARYLDRTLRLPVPVPLKFGSLGTVQISDWRVQNTRGIAQVDKVIEGGKPLLHIDTVADTNCIASWRSHVLLTPGEYHLEARVRTAGVMAIKDKKGEGAGIRISQFSRPRTNSAAGSTDWTKLDFDFPVAPGSTGDVDLLCELRASKGEAWFDLSSLKLTKK